MAKRKISIGFLKPSKLERSTIYANLLKDGKEKIYAQFYSNEDFTFPTYDNRGHLRIYQTGKSAKNTGLPPHFCGGNEVVYNEFLNEIIQKNNCFVEDKCLEDGFKLAETFSILEKRVFPNLINHLKEQGFEF